MRRIKSLFVLLAGIYLLAVVKDLYIQSLLRNLIVQATGLQTTIGTVSVSLLRSTLRAKEILLYNPEGFEERNFIRISEFFLRYNLERLLREERPFEEMRIVFEELFIVKNREGLVNLNTVRGPEVSKIFPMTADRLDVTVERITYRDHSNPFSSAQTFYPKIRHERFENFQNPREVIQQILLRSLAKHSLPKSVESEFMNLTAR